VKAKQAIIKKYILSNCYTKYFKLNGTMGLTRDSFNYLVDSEQKKNMIKIRIICTHQLKGSMDIQRKLTVGSINDSSSLDEAISITDSALRRCRS
jgi:hypothetical protein